MRRRPRPPARAAAVRPTPVPTHERADRRGPLRPARLVAARARLNRQAVAHSFQAVDLVAIGVLAWLACDLANPAGVWASPAARQSPLSPWPPACSASSCTPSAPTLSRAGDDRRPSRPYRGGVRPDAWRHGRDADRAAAGRAPLECRWDLVLPRLCRGLLAAHLVVVRGSPHASLWPAHAECGRRRRDRECRTADREGASESRGGGAWRLRRSPRTCAGKRARRPRAWATRRPSWAILSCPTSTGS